MDLSELISKLPAAEQEKLLEQVGQYKDAVTREKAQKSFMAFVKEMWPGFIHGRHHALMAKKFEEIAQGKLKDRKSTRLNSSHVSESRMPSSA